MKLLPTKFNWYWQNHPLPLIIMLGAFFRLIAVLFSKGFGMHDDHFLIIEAAQSWVDGYDYNNWLPSTKGVTQATGHSLLYPGVHFLLFNFLQYIGIYDAQSKMYVVRLLHAIYSLIVVWGAYKIVYKLNGIKAARESALLLAILFFIPMLSVRNLVEMVTMPPLILATWLLVKSENQNTKAALVAGILLGVAFSIRFQTITFIGGFIGVLFLLRQWRNFIFVIAGFILGVTIIQMVTDILIWKKPFVEITEYVRYNLANKETYGVSAWYKYILLIAGVLIPPLSLVIIMGYISSWRKYLIIFMPAFLFFIFHSVLPNKQERFILPILPFIIMGGIMGWHDIVKKNVGVVWLQKFYTTSWIVFLFLNIVPLCVISAAYSKRSRVEAMSYLKAKGDTEKVLIEESIHDDFKMPPLFYFGKWGHVYYLTNTFTMDSLLCELHRTAENELPQYVVFNQVDELESRVARFKSHFSGLVFETEIKPGFLDVVLHKLNPRNANFTSFIYKINYTKTELQLLKDFKCK